MPNHFPIFKQPFFNPKSPSPGLGPGRSAASGRHFVLHPAAVARSARVHHAGRLRGRAGVGTGAKPTKWKWFFFVGILHFKTANLRNCPFCAEMVFTCTNTICKCTVCISVCFFQMIRPFSTTVCSRSFKMKPSSSWKISRRPSKHLAPDWPMPKAWPKPCSVRPDRGPLRPRCFLGSKNRWIC